MNCPNCGAALEPVPNRTHLRCQHCTSIHFVEPVEEGLIPLDREFGQECPCCDRSLAAASLEGYTVGHCGECRGILANSEHFATVVASHRAANRGKQQPVEPIDPSEFRRATRCPLCQRRMDTHAYGGGGNAVIDSCARCHLVWLDAGELTVLEQYQATRG